MGYNVALTENVTEINKGSILDSMLNDLAVRLPGRLVDIALSVCMATETDMLCLCSLSGGVAWQGLFDKFVGADISESGKLVLSLDIVAVCLSLIVSEEFSNKVPSNIEPSKYVVSTNSVYDVVKLAGVSSPAVYLKSFENVEKSVRASEFNVSLSLGYLNDVWKFVNNAFVDEELFEIAETYTKIYTLITDEVMVSEKMIFVLAKIQFPSIAKIKARVNSSLSKYVVKYHLENFISCSDAETMSHENLVTFCNTMRHVMSCYMLEMIAISYKPNHIYNCIALDELAVNLKGVIPVSITDSDIERSFRICRGEILKILHTNQLKTNLDAIFQVGGTRTKDLFAVIVLAFNITISNPLRIIPPKEILSLCSKLEGDIDG